ncbi:MAG: MurR/RpiR family transcriptional regulator [Cellulosilyticaceae bacterium]
MNREKLIQGKKISETEKLVLEYITTNLENCLESGVRGVAKANYTSTSTVMRLAKKLGYNGFSEMVYDLRLKLEGIDTTADQELLGQDDLWDTDRLEDIEIFMRAIHEEQIFIYGSGFSSLIAEYMYKKLLVLGRRCWFVHSLEIETIINNYYESQKTVIIVSKSGQTEFLVNVAKKARAAGIKVICMTGNRMSQLAQQADVVFALRDHNPLDDDNLLENPFFGNCILLFEKIIGAYHIKYKK